jgi:hypothetical protein
MGFRDPGHSPEPAEAIFVFAGREGRKRSALALYRRGWAPRLIVSVGRFEWRRFEKLGLASDGGLVDMVEATAPTERHFFVHVTEEGTRCERVPMGRLGTLTEARGLAEVIAREGLRKLLIVSSPAHLTRCLVALRIFISQNIELVPIAATDDGEERRERFGALEAVKLLSYQALAIARRIAGQRRLA